MSDELTFKVSPDLVKPIIQEKIKLAIAEAFGGRENLLEEILKTYLQLRVNSEGKIGNYSSDNKFQLIDVLIQNMLREAIKEAVQLYLAEHKITFRDALVKYFASKKGSAEIVRATGDGLIQNMMNAWHFSVNIQFPKGD